ncbi:hypothetical protein GCM10011581_41370 [Saccharopolyspora subtropica]|uniref:Uncharacterized protein n=1 Tax=Saccharopolyspora thermophila TaxID=89367 RepID=A0A917K5L9_9PSEU|nr:hypothetical protein [Saccharopolyspora subtropica]GGI99935.1 hypothetical protein GCM10011581_41370 [Saccharopolyspora subtropica]
MRTVFIHGEVERFDAVRGELIERFTRARPGPEYAELLACLLDDKFGRDGLLAWWSEEELERFLVEVVPRRLVLPRWSAARDFLHDWLGFLADEGLLTSPDPLARLHDAVERAVPDFLAAMAEPSAWGLEKFWRTTMCELGVPPGDAPAVTAFFTSVDAGEVEVDGELLEEIEAREANGLDQPALWLPPVELAEEEPHRTVAARAPIVERMRTVLAWVGTGRDPSDVDELAAALGLGADEADLLLEWAERAGLVRSAGDLLVPTLVAEPLLAEPEVLWMRLWQRFVLVDDVFREQLAELGDEEDALPEIVQAALSVLYGRTDAVPVDLVVSVACDLLGGDVDREVVAGVLRRVLAQWEAMLAVRGFESPEHGRVVELLPAGVWAARESLRAFGFRVPAVDDLVPCPAELLAVVLLDTPPDVQKIMVPLWIDHRGTAQAAAELTALLRRVDDPSIRLAALALLEHTGPDGEAAVRDLAEHPVAGPAARVWLQSRPGNAETLVRPGDELRFALDGMAAAIEEDTTAFVAEFAQRPDAEQLELISDIAGTEHSSAAAVLATLADGHPDERMATAAESAISP